MYMDWSKHQQHGTHALTLISWRMDFKNVFMNSLYMSNLICRVTLCLYVDDLITTTNNLKLITEFKEMMISQFEITNIGLMFYFLGIWVIK